MQRRLYVYRLLLTSMFTIATASAASAGSITLAWDPAVDGITTGYVVSYGTASRTYTGSINVGAATTRRIDGLTDGVRYYFSVRAVSATGVLSEFSTEVSAMLGSVATVPPVSGPPSGGGAPSAGAPSGGGAPAGGEAPAPVSGAGSGSATAASTNVVAIVRDGRFIDINWLALSGISGYRVEVGAAPGTTAFSANTPNTTITFDTLNLPAASYFIRVRSVGAGGVPGSRSNEEVVTGGAAPRMDASTSAAGAACAEAPGAPRQFNSGAQGTSVRLSWQPGTGPGASSYVLQVGTIPGVYNLMTVPMPATETSLAANAALGVYALRLMATNDCGASVWGAESILNVGGVAGAGASAGPAPGAPGALTPVVEGTTVSLSWSAPSGVAVTRYLIEAMTNAGPVSVELGAGTSFTHPNTPAGQYVITVRAGNAAGFGPPSTPVTVIVQ